MKTPRFLFTIIAFGSLTLGPSYADEPSKPPTGQVLRQKHSTSDRAADPAHGNKRRDKIDQTDGEHSNPKDDSHTVKKIGQAGPIKTEPKRAAGGQLHQAALKKAAIAAREGPVMNRTGNPHEQLAMLPAGKEAGAPPPGLGPSRRAAAAAALGKILGVTRITSNAKSSAGALDGAAIQRKP